MSTRLIIDGNAVYEIDEDCLECSRGRKRKSVDGKRIPEVGKGMKDKKIGIQGDLDTESKK